MELVGAAVEDDVDGVDVDVDDEGAAVVVDADGHVISTPTVV